MSKFVLKVLWLEKTIAIALDQRVGSTTHPLTEYYFWPRKDAWEELKNQLDINPWISQNDAIFLLNQITDIINCWQEENKSNSLKKAQEKFSDCLFVGHY